jgi:sulfite reductase beta subunit-like hemoprotein
MAAVDDPKTFGRARTSFADAAEIDEFVAKLEAFENGELGPDQWRSFRLLRGTYGQRQPDVQMIRVKIPQGLMDVPQIHALADVAERYSRGFGHITTRQNLQFHFVKLADVASVFEIFTNVGLTTREACGNSVRNITACPYAGVSGTVQRSADALLPASSAQFVAAAQVQDCVRGLLRGSRLHRDQRHRLPRAHPDQRGWRH